MCIIDDKDDALSLEACFLVFIFCRARLKMVFFYLILSFLINVIQIDSTLDSCRQTFGSNQYDLNRLSHLTILGAATIYTYAFTPCGPVSVDRCGQNPSPFEPGMTACQVNNLDPTPRFESAMGFLDGSGHPPNIEFSENPDGPGTGVTMTMRNAKCNGLERLVRVIFTCDESAQNPTRMEVVEFPSCEFTIRIQAAEACPIKPSKSGTSGGTIFVILLLVLVVVYVLGGVIYNRFKEQKTGLALLPHPNFWILLSELFLNGCRFTLTYVRTCGLETSPTYQSK